jgi:hypothetical protein
VLAIFNEFVEVLCETVLKNLRLLIEVGADHLEGADLRSQNFCLIAGYQQLSKGFCTQ